MTSIVVFGGTGYAGSAIVREARERGHDVRVVTRHAPAEPVAGVTYRQVGDAPVRELVAGAQAVVGALSPRNGSEGALPGVYRELADAAAAEGARLLVVGGFGSLRPEDGAPRLAEGADWPDWLRPEAMEMVAVLDGLRQTDGALDWVFVSPAQEFGARREQGEPTGSYRVGGDVALFDDAGRSVLEVADFADAILDEIERAQHHRAHISVVS